VAESIDVALAVAGDAAGTRSRRSGAAAQLGALLLIGAAGCASATRPSPAELGNRVRVRIVSRGDIPSITTADYRLLLMLRTPDGRLETFGVHAPATSDCESIAGALAVKIRSVFALPVVFCESLRADDPTLVHDFVLPAGYTLDFTPGRFYAYRVADPSRRKVADLAPEIRIGQITADGGRYLELQPTAGPEVRGSADPPGWPPKDG